MISVLILDRNSWSQLLMYWQWPIA
jgi:hypothetical protein